MKEPTEKQAEVLAAFKRLAIRLGRFPSIREMMDETGIKSTNGVQQMLVALERKGYMRRMPGKKGWALAGTTLEPPQVTLGRTLETAKLIAKTLPAEKALQEILKLLQDLSGT